MSNKPDCYKCSHRGEVSGDAHSCCNHPDWPKLKIMGNPMGIRRGWFFWPTNFDPTWLDSCNGFKEKNGS